MKRRLRSFLRERGRRFGYRLEHGPQKRLVRCPRCHAVQLIPVVGTQTKVVCRRCGEIFLR